MKMKNLDLNKYGVQEMNAEEMQETNGGLFPFVIVGLLILTAIDIIQDGKLNGIQI